VLKVFGTFLVALIGLRVAESIGAGGHYFAQGALEGLILAAVYAVGSINNQGE